MFSASSGVSVVIAAMNEEQGIGLTLREIERNLGDVSVIVVDGVSSDKTAQIAKKCGALVINRERRGKGDAIASALDYLKKDCKYVIFIDADYTYPACFLPQMLEIIKKNHNVGMVSGNRFNLNLRIEKMSDLFYLGNRVLCFLHQVLNRVFMKDPLSGLRVVRWNLLRNWRPKAKGFDIEVEMNKHVCMQGYDIIEVDIPYRQRLGSKKLKARHGFKILKRIISETIH
jgi:dolichol-phosphate mannosyltransferase